MTCKVSPPEVKAARQIVSDTSGRLFELFSEIDDTVGGSVWLARILRANTEWIEGMTVRIKTCDCNRSIDADNSCVESLGFSQEIANSFYRRLIRCRDKSKGANNDDLAKAISESLKQLADFHNAIYDLRWAVMGHDANSDPAFEQNNAALKSNPLKVQGRE